MPDEDIEAPYFEGTDIIGNVEINSDENPEDIILLSFFIYQHAASTSVIDCLVELWRIYEDHNVQIVLVYPTDDPLNTQSEATVREWLENDCGVSFRVIYGGDSWIDYMDGLAGRDKPQTFIIDRINSDGIRFIRGRHYDDGTGLPGCEELKCSMLIVKVEREPIDLEMVMDVSGSMNRPSPNATNGDSKFDMMKQAIRIIGNYLNANSLCNDRMGLIWFTDDAEEYDLNDQKLLPIPANWEPELRPKLDDLLTGNCTAMGAGLQTAFNTLNHPLNDNGQKKFVILCTDGMQNINPLVKKVPEGHYEIIDVDGEGRCGPHSPTVGEVPNVDIATYTIPVFTIGIGITENYEHLLEEIATKTGASYRGTNDPDNDLNLAYLASLCNSLAGGSPSILYHNVGSLSVEEHKKAEIFYLNNTVRKITAILSWKKSQESNFMFWLYSPDETLLNLYSEMKLYEDHCMATIHLPKRQNGENLKYAGEWRMVIRGELPTTPADYHVFIIGEDTDTKLLVDFPRKPYVVGDLLPIKVAVLKKKKPIVVKPKEIILEIKSLQVPLPELLAEYEVSVNELKQKMKKATKKDPKNPLILKLNAMTTDPQFQKRLMPFTQRLSLQKGDFELKIENKKTFIPIELEQPGLHSFKITVRYEDPENGPICRTDMVSIIVGPGKADPEQTKINFIEPSTDKLKGKIIKVTPRNKKGQLLGPGYSYELKLKVGKKEFDVEFKDLLDGTYQIEPPISEKEMERIKEKDLDVDITFHNSLIWRGKL